MTRETCSTPQRRRRVSPESYGLKRPRKIGSRGGLLLYFSFPQQLKKLRDLVSAVKDSGWFGAAVREGSGGGFGVVGDITWADFGFGAGGLGGHASAGQCVCNQMFVVSS